MAFFVMCRKCKIEGSNEASWRWEALLEGFWKGEGKVQRGRRDVWMMCSVTDKRERAEEQITAAVQPHDSESTGNAEHTPFGSGSTPTDNEIAMAAYREKSATKPFWAIREGD